MMRWIVGGGGGGSGAYRKWTSSGTCRVAKSTLGVKEMMVNVVCFLRYCHSAHTAASRVTARDLGAGRDLARDARAAIIGTCGRL